MIQTAPIASITPHFRQVTPATIWSFVRVQTRDGAVGWGEATINGRAREIGVDVRRQAAALAGTQPDLRQRLTPLAPGQLGFAVTSAIDQALWDIYAQTRGQPLAAVLGATPRSTVPLYANINRGTTQRTPAGFAASADAAARAGFTAVKMAPFDGMQPALAGTAEGRAFTQAGIDRIAAAHAALAGRAALMVDCHWRFTPAVAEAVLQELGRIGVAWFECPIPEIPANIQAVRRLRGLANAAGMQLAGMEEASLVEGFLPWADAYDVVMPDVKYTVGLMEALAIAEQLAAKGAKVSLHNPTGSVCHATSLHVSAVMASDMRLEMQWGETDWLYDLPDPALPRPHNGSNALPAGPGHGAALKLDRLVEEAGLPPV